MKTELLKAKINDLILTGNANFKGTNSKTGKWLSDKTLNQFFDFLHGYHSIESTDIKRIDETSLRVESWNFDGKLVIFGKINLY